MTRMFRLMSAAMVMLMTVAVGAQDGQAPAQAARAGAGLVSLKVSLVLSRYQGDKKLTSMPYTLSVIVNDRASLRMGTQIPVPTTVIGVGKDGEASKSYSYKDVGTNIDCLATSPHDGTYKLTLTVSDSSVYYPDQTEPVARSIVASTGAPAFRSFMATFSILLRDGQTTQYTTATDQMTGQVLKIDATLNVQK